VAGTSRWYRHDGGEPGRIRWASIDAVTIPDLGSDLIGVAARTAIVYVVLVIGFRVVGKRAAGQLSTTNLVVLLIVANAVQNAMVGENTSLAAGLLAAGIILALDILLNVVADRWPPLRDWLDGVPTLLVENGEVMTDNLRREGINERELGIALRQNGLLTPDEASFVYLEPNGAISVIPRRDDDDSGARPTGAWPAPAGRRRRRLGRLPGVPS
jgi:uncharacterized membrane protein YcaP (DUF421 family)